jgi:hypothetical protein
MELFPLEYILEKQAWVMESRVPRTLFGMSPPNEAMHAANEFVAVSLENKTRRQILHKFGSLANSAPFVVNPDHLLLFIAVIDLLQ